MDILFDNPLVTMYGPTFLLLYLSVIVLTLITTKLGLYFLDDTPAPINYWGSSSSTVFTNTPTATIPPASKSISATP